MFVRKALVFGVFAGFLAAGTASAQQPNWQELAIGAQQNAARDHMVSSAMINAMQAEINDLKGQLVKAQKEKSETQPGDGAVSRFPKSDPHPK